MATIELSSGFMAGLPNRILRLGENVVTNHNGSLSGLLMAGSGNYGSPNGSIAIMKGAVPANFSTLTSFAARSADVLVYYSVNSGHFAPTQATVNPAVISTLYSTAQASGTATWFWWTVRPGYEYDNPNAIVNQALGTVGLVGSGADLEMAATNITVGEPYRIMNLRIQFPSSWVY